MRRDCLAASLKQPGYGRFEMVARILACVVALFLGSLAVNWLFDPASAAANLGMPLLDGIGRSAQVGDFTALFASGSALCLLGAIRQETPWLYSAALVLGSAALFRATAWALHGAGLATVSIAAELVMMGMLIGSAVMMGGRRAR
jgi:hypothetical protein